MPFTMRPVTWVVVEVIVADAGRAGASLAILLARAGHRVALADRTSFPSDTTSTHVVRQRGAARLESWGLLDRLVRRGCAPSERITVDVGPVQLSGIGSPVGAAGHTYCRRSIVLDALLVDAAVEAGAELVDRFVVDDLLLSDGRVAGVSGHRRGSVPSSLEHLWRPSAVWVRGRRQRRGLRACEIVAGAGPGSESRQRRSLGTGRAGA